MGVCGGTGVWGLQQTGRRATIALRSAKPRPREAQFTPGH